LEEKREASRTSRWDLLSTTWSNAARRRNAKAPGCRSQRGADIVKHSYQDDPERGESDEKRVGYTSHLINDAVGDDAHNQVGHQRTDKTSMCSHDRNKAGEGAHAQGGNINETKKRKKNECVGGQADGRILKLNCVGSLVHTESKGE